MSQPARLTEPHRLEFTDFPRDPSVLLRAHTWSWRKQQPGHSKGPRIKINSQKLVLKYQKDWKRVAGQRTFSFYMVTNVPPKDTGDTVALSVLSVHASQPVKGGN